MPLTLNLGSVFIIYPMLDVDFVVLVGGASTNNKVAYIFHGTSYTTKTLTNNLSYGVYDAVNDQYVIANGTARYKYDSNWNYITGASNSSYALTSTQFSINDDGYLLGTVYNSSAKQYYLSKYNVDTNVLSIGNPTGERGNYTNIGNYAYTAYYQYGYIMPYTATAATQVQYVGVTVSCWGLCKTDNYACGNSNGKYIFLKSDGTTIGTTSGTSPGPIAVAGSTDCVCCGLTGDKIITGHGLLYYIDTGTTISVSNWPSTSTSIISLLNDDDDIVIYYGSTLAIGTNLTISGNSAIYTWVSIPFIGGTSAYATSIITKRDYRNRLS